MVNDQPSEADDPLMSATSRPKLDAVVEWISNGRVGEIAWPEPPRWPDPPEWDDPGPRLEAVIAMCASGAPAELSSRTVVINGKPIPEPPRFRHGQRNRPPRPRKVTR
jgi:hypothetical protein